MPHLSWREGGAKQNPILLQGAVLPPPVESRLTIYQPMNHPILPSDSQGKGRSEEGAGDGGATVPQAQRKSHVTKAKAQWLGLALVVV